MVVTAAAAAVVLLVIGGAALLTRSSGGTAPPVVDEPDAATTVTTEAATTVTSQPATTVPVAPSTTVSPQPPRDGSGWTALEVAAVGSGGFIADVAESESGLVAVGYECGVDCSTVSGAVWLSSDGSAWERAVSETGDFGSGSLRAVEPGGPGWVTIGLEEGRDGGLGVAIWLSDDGRVWEQAPPIPEFTGIARVPVGLAGNESQIIAVGTGNDELGTFGRVWSSSDGVSWTVTAELRDAELLKVVSSGTGFLALGSAVSENDDWVVAVWASEDGVDWTQVLEQTEVFGAQLGAIAAGANTAIAVGDGPDPVWVSPDGVTWTRVEGLALPMEISAAIADDQGFVIVGRGAWWSSADGVTWTQNDEDLFVDAGVGAVVRAGPGLVAVGARPGQIPTVWVWSPPPG